MTENKNKNTVSEGTVVVNTLDFPNRGVSGKKPVSTIANLEYLLARHNIQTRYELITKKIDVSIPGHIGTCDNEANVVLSHVISLASQYGMATTHIPEYLSAIADKNTFNCVEDWIVSLPWDGIDRLPEFYDTLTTREGYPVELKVALLHRWMLSAVAAAVQPAGFKSRGVLTLQGDQSIGKTSWIRALIPDGILREKVMKLDHHLDASNKDTVITAISHWIVEIGELDSSFKKDVARLKGFLSSDVDKVRKPYARANTETGRRTVFAATVNEENFLVDQTGNTRFWTLPVVEVNYQHGLKMQQIFAQLLEEYKAGEKWWLTAEEEQLLEVCNKDHQSVSVVEEIILEQLDMTSKQNYLITAKQLLACGGLKTPTNAQCKDANQVLRKLFGDKAKKKYEGIHKWSLPLRQVEDVYDSKLELRLDPA